MMSYIQLILVVQVKESDASESEWINVMDEEIVI